MPEYLKKNKTNTEDLKHIDGLGLFSSQKGCLNLPQVLVLVKLATVDLSVVTLLERGMIENL